MAPGIVDTTGLGFTNFTAFKSFFLDGSRAFFSRAAMTITRLQRDNTNVVGNEVLGSFEALGTEGFSGSHDDRLPDPHFPTNIPMRFPLVDHFARGKIGGKLIQAARTSPGAFVNAFKQLLMAKVRDLRFDMNGEVYGDGSGRLATIDITGSTLASGILKVGHPFDLPADVDAWEGGVPHRLRVGMPIFIVDTTLSTAGAQLFLATDNAATQAQMFFITAVDRLNNLITISLTAGGSGADLQAGGDIEVAPIDGDVIVRSKLRSQASGINLLHADAHTQSAYRKAVTGNNNANTGCAELMGFYGLANNAGVFEEYTALSTAATEYLQAINHSTYPEWKAYVDSNSGTPRAITVPMVQKAFDAIEEDGMGVPTAMFTSRAVRRRIRDSLMQDNIRYVNPDVQTKMGSVTISTIGWGPVPILVDLMCPASSIIVADESKLHMATLEEMNFIDRDGHILSRLPDHYAFQFALVYSAQLWTSQRNCLARIDDIDVTP